MENPPLRDPIVPPHDSKETFGQRMADQVAEFGGSWTFIGCFALVLVCWIAVNTALMAHPYDPYPFILLNLILSCLAAIQAPIIMMSQNRMEAKDRQRAIRDFHVNRKAEREIRELHVKLDELSTQHRQLLQLVEDMHRRQQNS